MKRRVASFVMCAGLCAAMLAGCGNSGGNSASDSTAGNSGSSESTADSSSADISDTSDSGESSSGEQNAAGTDIKIGFAMKTLNNSYFSALVGAVEDLCAEEGWECTSLSADMDTTKEAENLESFITQGMDLIFLDSVDPNACVPSINAAAEQDIPVVNLDSAVSECEQCTTIYADNFQNGRMVGLAYTEQLPEDEEIIAIMISSLKGNVACRERRTGLYAGIIEGRTGCTEEEAAEQADAFEDEVANAGSATLEEANFTVRGQGWGDATRQQGLEAAEDLIAANTDLTCVLGDASENCLGAMTALENAGIEGVDLVSASDGPFEVLDLIKEGKFFGCGENSPWMVAEMGIEVAKEILIDGADWRSYPEVTRTEAVAITQENVDERYEFGY